MVYRPTTAELLYRTTEQQHDFNFPRQLGTNSDDYPEHSEIQIVDVKVGDIVLLATDGLFDNVFDEDIIRILADGKTNTEYKAAVIAKTAYKQSLDPSYLSPFAKKEAEYF